MEPTDLTIELLKSIRDEIKGVKLEVSPLKQGQAETNERLEALERRQSETEMRLATELVSIVGALGEVKTLLKENYAATIHDHERRITALENRASG